MPTYEYACKSCGSHVDVVQSFTDDPLTECETCGGPLRKVFGSIGITFKGSGFYRTDSRSASSSGKAPRSAGDGGGAKERGGDSSASGDSSSSSDSGASSSTSGDSGSGSGSAKPAKSASA